MLPLYAQIPQDTFKQAKTAHSGLLFDKFPDGWGDKKNNYQLADDVKKQFLKNIIEKYNETKPTLTLNLLRALENQRDLVKNHLNGEQITATTDWRFVSGLGAAHPYETGFIWHRTLSVPYIPGSSVKGLMRAWAEQWGGLADVKEVNRLFGTEEDLGQCGAFIVFDALPTVPPKLEVDILNPHYSEYYQNPANPPADYLSPVPVFFLTVAPGQNFEFFLVPRQDYYLKQSGEKQYSVKTDLKTAKTLLSDALVCLGVGGKTAVGYGQMTSDEHKGNELAQKAEKWLVDIIEELKKDKDLKGQPEENLWKKPLSEKWRQLPEELKLLTLENIKIKWKELGIDWHNPKGGSASEAKRNFTK